LLAKGKAWKRQAGGYIAQLAWVFRLFSTLPSLAVRAGLARILHANLFAFKRAANRDRKTIEKQKGFRVRIAESLM
jgi:hypothetical protein